MAHRPWSRVALCISIAGAQLAPAAPAVAVVIQAQSAQSGVIPGVNGLPLWTAPGLRAAPRLGASLAPGLSGSVPVLPAPAVRKSVRPAPAELPIPQAPAVRPDTMLVAPFSAPAQSLAAEGSPAAVGEGLARAGSLISGDQDRGGEKTGAALDSLFGEDTPRQIGSVEPVAGDAVPAAVLGPQLLKAQPAVRGVVTSLSPRIVKTADELGQNIEFEVGVADLLRQPDARSRADLSRQVAREALAALGSADTDGRQTAALGDFLRDIADYRPEGAVSARLEMDGRNHFRLVFERGDGGRKVLLGQFLPGTTPDAGPSGDAFILMGPAEVSAAGKVRQDHPGYWREYAGGNLRREWRAAQRVEKKGWGPWAYELGLRDASLMEQVWRDGGWQDAQSRPVKTVTTVQARSWLGRASDNIFKVPVLGPVLKFCDNVAETVLTGLMIAQHMLASALAGPRLRNIEAGGDFAKNPLIKLLTRDQWHIDRLSPAAREKLDAKVREERAAAVAAQLFPVSPELARLVTDAPIGAAEAVTALRSHYGIGTFGRRLIHAGAAAQGWKRFGLIAGGVLTGAVEGAAESVCNPILWAMLGLGTVAGAAEGAVGAAGKVLPAAAAGAAPLLWAADGALPGLVLAGGEFLAALRGAAVSARAAGALAGLYALRTAQAAATVLWWGPWLVSATDHVGRMVQLTAQGEFDKDYFKNLSKAGTDVLYYFVIP